MVLVLFRRRLLCRVLMRSGLLVLTSGRLVHGVIVGLLLCLRSRLIVLLRRLLVLVGLRLVLLLVLLLLLLVAIVRVQWRRLATVMLLLRRIVAVAQDRIRRLLRLIRLSLVDRQLRLGVTTSLLVLTRLRSIVFRLSILSCIVLARLLHCVLHQHFFKNII